MFYLLYFSTRPEHVLGKKKIINWRKEKENTCVEWNRIKILFKKHEVCLVPSLATKVIQCDCNYVFPLAMASKDRTWSGRLSLLWVFQKALNVLIEKHIFQWSINYLNKLFRSHGGSGDDKQDTGD